MKHWISVWFATTTVLLAWAIGLKMFCTVSWSNGDIVPNVAVRQDIVEKINAHTYSDLTIVIEDIRSPVGQLSAHFIQHHADLTTHSEMTRVATMEASDFNNDIQQFYNGIILRAERISLTYRILYVTTAINRADIVVRALTANIPKHHTALVTPRVITERDAVLYQWIGAAKSVYAEEKNVKNLATWRTYPDGHFATAYRDEAGQVVTYQSSTPMFTTFYGPAEAPLSSGQYLNTLLHYHEHQQEQEPTYAACGLHSKFDFDKCVSVYTHGVPLSTVKSTQLIVLDGPPVVFDTLLQVDTLVLSGTWTRAGLRGLVLEDISGHARVQCRNVSEDNYALLGACHNTAKLVAGSKWAFSAKPNDRIALPDQYDHPSWIYGSLIVQNGVISAAAVKTT